MARTRCVFIVRVCVYAGRLVYCLRGIFIKWAVCLELQCRSAWSWLEYQIFRWMGDCELHLWSVLYSRRFVDTFVFMNFY